MTRQYPEWHIEVLSGQKRKLNVIWATGEIARLDPESAIRVLRGELGRVPIFLARGERRIYELVEMVPPPPPERPAPQWEECYATTGAAIRQIRPDSDVLTSLGSEPEPLQRSDTEPRTLDRP